LNFTDTSAGNITAFNYLSFRDVRGWPKQPEPVNPHDGPFIGNSSYFNEKAWTALDQKCQTKKISVCQIVSSSLINYIEMEYDNPTLCPAVYTSGPSSVNCFDPTIPKVWTNETISITEGALTHYSTMKSNDTSIPNMICSFSISTGGNSLTFGDTSTCDNKDIPLSSSS
jgi:hypothetical protein